MDKDGSGLAPRWSSLKHLGALRFATVIAIAINSCSVLPTQLEMLLADLKDVSSLQMMSVPHLHKKKTLLVAFDNFSC